MKPFSKINPKDLDTQRLQNNVSNVFDSLTGCPLLNGYLKQGVALLAANTTQVSHGLARVPQGWFNVSPTSNVNVWQAKADSKFLYLQCSSDCTVDLYIF